MKLVIELGVTSKNHVVIKECIHPYKNTCLTTNQIRNLDGTVRLLMDKVEKDALEAKKNADPLNEDTGMHCCAVRMPCLLVLYHEQLLA